jgi:hypothetical protein
MLSPIQASMYTTAVFLLLAAYVLKEDYEITL